MYRHRTLPAPYDANTIPHVHRTDIVPYRNRTFLYQNISHRDIPSSTVPYHADTVQYHTDTLRHSTIPYRVVPSRLVPSHAEPIPYHKHSINPVAIDMQLTFLHSDPPPTEGERTEAREGRSKRSHIGHITTYLV